MKAIQIDTYGGPEGLILRDIPSPTPGLGQVLVTVKATSFNPIDIKLASGEMKDFAPLDFPWTPGADFSGTVEAVGAGVDSLKVGNEVYGYSSLGGSYADKLVIDAGAVNAKPTSIDDVEAASIALVGQTALLALQTAGLGSGQSILIHGAAGGVGSVAVQIAHAIGAYVIATGAAESGDLLQSYGADVIIDYKTTQFDDVVKDVDVVLDTLGGETQQRSFAVLKPGGILVALSQPPSEETAKAHNVRAIMLNTQSTAEGLNVLTKYVDDGDVRPNVGKVYPLSEMQAVWSGWKSMHVSGKIVFKVSE